MEPSSIELDRNGSGARLGSIDDPEIVQDVPGHVIPILEREFDDFETEAKRFLDGTLEPDEFTKFRLRQGVYGQRQEGVQMIRVKLPFGGVTPDQLDAFAAVIKRYVPLQKGHITTRQNIQMHNVRLKDAAKLIRELGDDGLTSREGCGNTVRNVTGDPRAGLLEGELFDITPYAGAYIRYFVRHPTTQAMPRKVKTAFAATDADNAITRIHDISFIPRLRDGVRGVEMRVGGGTSIMPRLAPTLYEFVELGNGDYLKISEACFRIFDRQDFLRVNRARARIKVLVDKIGIDAFRDLVEQELEGEWVSERDFSVDPLLWAHDEEAHARTRREAAAANGAPANDAAANGAPAHDAAANGAPANDAAANGAPAHDAAANGAPANDAAANGAATNAAGAREYERFLESNVQPQRQQGFSTVEVKVRRGDLTVDQLRGLAQIMRAHTGEYARTTVQQNLVLRWVPDDALADVWRGLVEIGLGAAGAGEITDVVSCPGTDSCKLGITSSMGLNLAVGERLEAMLLDDQLARAINVKISGCPNGCSQHHIANIGFYGASIKVGEHTIPAYVPHLAGAFKGGDVRYGHRLKARLPAKRVPEAVERWVRLYLAQRHDEEQFNDFAERVGTDEFERQVKDLTLPAKFSPDSLDLFIDWSRRDPFQVARGEGECAV
jgi:sulfite reductase beta subunit-like hemoprotein